MTCHLHSLTHVLGPQVPNGGPHKKSTFGKLFAGSHFFTSKYIEPKGRSATVSTVQLSQNTGKTTLPSSTYRGNGNFTLELPHTSVTYRRTWSTKNTAMQSEYSSKFLGQRSVRGASTTPSVLTRKF